jgi:uncharacterized DUF497 family protein
VPITFDPGKNERNIAERGLPFELVEDFEWDGALIVEDVRKDYGETGSSVGRDKRSAARVGVHASRRLGPRNQSSQSESTQGQTL